MAQQESNDSKEVLDPERVHRALNVIRKGSWGVPIGLAIGLFFSLLFMLLGEIPMTGEGRAMFLTPGTVVPFEATASGQIVQWHKNVGDEVQKGDLLASLDQPDIAKQLEQAEARLGELTERNKVIEEMLDTYTGLALEAVAQRESMLRTRVQALENQIGDSRGITQRNFAATRELMKQKKESLEAARKVEIQRLAEEQQKLDTVRKLRAQQLRTEDQLVDAQQSVINQRIRLSDATLRLVRHSLDEARDNQKQLDAQNDLQGREEALMDLKLELGEIENRRIELERQRAETRFQQELEIAALEREIDRLRQQLSENSSLLAERSGRILELTRAPGEVISKGVRLGSIDTHDGTRSLKAVSYFTVKDGKRIQPGMQVRLTPSTVQQERFGSLVATVDSVAAFPVTADGAATVVGNSKVASDLTKDGRVIEVVLNLETDPNHPTGFRWDLAGGPSFPVTSGTLATAHADIERVPPLAMVVPILRHWQGFF